MCNPNPSAIENLFQNSTVLSRFSNLLSHRPPPLSSLQFHYEITMDTEMEAEAMMTERWWVDCFRFVLTGMLMVNIFEKIDFGE